MKKPLSPPLPANSTMVSNESTPVLPGTETPRSLGDFIRDASRSMEHPEPVTEKQTASQNTSKNRPRVKKVSRAKARRGARQRVLQALYQWELSNGQSSTIRQEFIDTQDMSRVDVEFFIRLFNGVSHHPDRLDETLAGSLDRPIDSLDPIERSVLRMATYELLELLETPVRVIINESIEITKQYGADQGHRYVNGVLDKLAVRLRSAEMRKR